MADQPTYTKDPSTGAFYIDSQSGLQLVTDSGTLQGLEQGTIPTETSSPANTTYSPAGGASYQPSSATTDPKTGIDSSDPYTRFNMAILDMLRTAQQGGQNTNLIAQGTALNQLQTNTNLNPQTFGGGSVAGLSPSQISQIEGANSNLYTPEQDVVSNAIKAQDSRLSNFEGILSQLNTMGNNIATMNPGPDVISGYVNALTHGASTTSIPEAVRAKVISSMTDDQWKQYEDAQKKGIIGSASSGYYQLQDDGTYQLLVPGTGNNTNNGLSKPLTSSQIQKLETSGVFNQQDVQSIQKYIENGQDLSALTFDNPDQTKVWQTVMGGTTSTIPTKNNISSALQQLQTQYGTSNKWSQDDWATRKSDFLSQYPNDASAASSAFTTMFPKPAAPKSVMTVIGDVLGQGLQDLQGLMPKF